MKAVSGRELCRLLERKGWVCIRIRGSHHCFEKTDHPLLVVPVHGNKTLKIGTLRAIMKAAGLSEADF